MKYSLFIGRYQVPGLHGGHRALIQSVIDEGKHICIGVRDVEKDDVNPYEPEVVFKKIVSQIEDFGWGNRVFVMLLPDISEVCYGRGVGYDIREIKLDAATEAISATEIRNKKSGGEKPKLADNSNDGDDVHSASLNRGDSNSTGNRGTRRSDKVGDLHPSRESVGP